MLLEKTFRFEASHQIHNHPGKCARLHGHSWVLKVCIDGPVNSSTGMVLDYYDIKQIIQPIVDRLDHQHLGYGVFPNIMSRPVLCSTVAGLNIMLPTSENLLLWLAAQMPTDFPWAYLALEETCTSSALLTHEEYRHIERKETNHGFGENEKSRKDEETKGSKGA